MIDRIHLARSSRLARTAAAAAVSGLLPLLVLGGALTGCRGVALRTLVRAPNHGASTFSDDVDLPDAIVAASSVSTLRVPLADGDGSTWAAVLTPRGDSSPAGRGTIVVLHGWHNDALTVAEYAGVFLDDGFHVVLVDLRGHGRSHGEWLTYGVRERLDLVRLLDELTARVLIAGPVGVFGVSYGAATALQLAAIDRRVQSVVAVASFSSLRAIAPRYVRWVPVWGWLQSDASVRAIVDEAGERAGFDPDDASPEQAVASIDVPALLVHGADDRLIPPEHSRALLAASGPTTEFVEIGGLGHNAAFHDAHGPTGSVALDWFRRTLQPSRSGSADQRERVE